MPHTLRRRTPTLRPPCAATDRALLAACSQLQGADAPGASPFAAADDATRSDHELAAHGVSGGAGAGAAMTGEEPPIPTSGSDARGDDAIDGDAADDAAAGAMEDEEEDASEGDDGARAMMDEDGDDEAKPPPSGPAGDDGEDDEDAADDHAHLLARLALVARRVPQVADAALGVVHRLPDRVRYVRCKM